METAFDSNESINRMGPGIDVDNILYQDRFVILSEHFLKLRGFHFKGTKPSESRTSLERTGGLIG